MKYRRKLISKLIDNSQRPVTLYQTWWLTYSLERLDYEQVHFAAPIKVNINQFLFKLIEQIASTKFGKLPVNN